jgi:hypothetical protein
MSVQQSQTFIWHPTIGSLFVILNTQPYLAMTLQNRIKEKIDGQLKGAVNEESIETISQLLTADVKFIATQFAAYAGQHPEMEVNQLFNEWFKNHFNDPLITTFE